MKWQMINNYLFSIKLYEEGRSFVVKRKKPLKLLKSVEVRRIKDSDVT